MNRQGYVAVNRPKIAAGLAMAVLLALRGAAVTWVGSTGSFTNGANWDTGWVPTNSVDATVYNGGAAVFDGGSASVAILGLGSGSGSGALWMQAGALTGQYVRVGTAANGTGTVVQGGGSIVSTSSSDPSFGIGYAAGSVGSYTLSDGGIVAKGGTFHVGSTGNGTLVQSGGVVTGNSWIVVARYLGSVGNYTLSGGVLSQPITSSGIVVGEQGYGVLTVTNAGFVSVVGSLAVSGGSTGGEGTGVVNLCLGGTIYTPIVKKNSGTHATFNFDGGLLRVRGDGATITNFMQGLTAVSVKSGGANIDTGSNTATIAQSLADAGGGLVKTGDGVLVLSGTNTYSGATIVSNGVLSAMSSAALAHYASVGQVQVCAGACLALGVGGAGAWSEEAAGALAGSAAFADGSFVGFDTSAGNATVSQALSFSPGLVKVGVNTLTLSGNDSYQGGTRVLKGVLQADFGVGLPAATNVTLDGGTLSTAGGSLILALGDGAGQVNIASNRPAGFSAYGSPLAVNLGGAAGKLGWGTKAFSPNPLLLNEVGADSALVFANSLDLQGGGREIDVNATTSSAAATVIGNIVDSVGAGGLTKAGNGVLTLAGTNVFGGAATVSAGLLALTSPSNVMGAVTVSTGGRLTVDGAVVRVPYFGLTVGGSGAGLLNVCNGGIYCASNVYVGLNLGSTGTVALTNGTLTCGTLRVGNSGTGLVVQTGGTLGRVSGGDWIVGVTGSGVGTYMLSGGTLDTGYSNFQLGYNGRGTLLQTGGTLNSGAWPSIGRYLGGVGVYTLSGGAFNQTGTGNGLVVGEQGLGTFTVGGTGVANLYGPLYMSGGGSGNQGTGIVNLCTGGTINAPIIKKNSGSSATFNFDGGVLRTRANLATTNFMEGLTAAYVKAGGAVIDSSNNNITVAQSLASGASPDGGLIKRGSGSLTLLGTNTYNGATVVSNGILRIGSSCAAPVGGAVTVDGGTYDLGGFAVTSGAVTVRSGAVVGGTLVPSSLVLYGGTVSASLSGDGTVTKCGDGVASLIGTNACSALVSVQGGTLRTGCGPTHRWSFNGSLADSAGGSDAVALGSVAAGAKQYTLAGGARGTSYLALGSNLLSTTTPVTIELWATQNSIQNWSRVFDFGANMPNFIMMSWSMGTSLTSDRVETQQNGVSTKVDNSMQPYTLGTEYHIAMVITPNVGGNGKVLFRWYKMNALGTTLTSSSMCSTNYTLVGLVQTNMWLGHSEYSDYDAGASYNEVRIWDQALTEAQLATNSVLGADTLPALGGGALSASSSVALASGSVLDLGGSSQAMAGLSGSGVVSNGSLAVTGTVAPGGTNVIGTLTLNATVALTGTLLVDAARDGSCDRLVAGGNLDLTGLSLQMQDKSLLKPNRTYVIATCAACGLTGPFKSTNLDGSGWQVGYNAAIGDVVLVNQGTLVLVR